jgi:hypothetical protein
MNTEKKFLHNKSMQDNLINNSSIFTAENSSTIQTNKINSFNNSIINNRKKKKINESKYLNETIFDKNKNQNLWIKNPDLTTKNTTRNNFPLYLTEMSNYKYSSRNKNESIDNMLSNRKTFVKNNRIKVSLPTLKCFSHRNNEKYPDLFNCDELILKPKLLTKLYYKQNKDKDEMSEELFNTTNGSRINHQIKRSVKESTKDYIERAKKINLLNYKINMRKEALEEYQENMKSQMMSLDYTISQINNYKSNLENNLFIKYNEERRVFDRHIILGKQELDNQKNTLLSLLKEVSILSQAISKKETIKKRYDKWLAFQVLVKEGEIPKTNNIKEYLDKKYGDQPIFENYDDFFIAFKEKEDRNIRLLESEEKVIIEKDEIKKEYNELKNDVENNQLHMDLNVKEKEKVLNLLKIRNKELNSIKKGILRKNKRYISKSFKTKYKTTLDLDIQKNIEIVIDDIKLNSLGIYYYNLEGTKNIYQMINCIYLSILKNEVPKLVLPYDIIYKIKNQILSKSQKAIYQLKIIELSLNYVKSYINTKKNSDKNCKKIIKETYNQIDLYHKWEKDKIYKEKQQKKFFEFFVKMEEKSKKIIFVQNRKVENYPSGLLARKKTVSVSKNKNNNFELFDFLYDNSSSNKKKDKED